MADGAVAHAADAASAQVRPTPWPAYAGLLAAVCVAAFALTLAPGVTWANNGLDSGELIAVAVVGGVTHPNGYPTYTLLARGAAGLLPSDPARAVTALSALAATLTALTIGDLVRRWAAVAEPWASVAGLMAGISLAFGPLFWSQAVIAEVYSLGALFTAVLLRAAILAALDGPPPPRYTFLLAIFAGLALGVHLTLVTIVLLWAVSDAVAAGRSWRLARTAAGIGLGLLVYLYLPLAAAGGPPIVWGDPTGWDGFWWLVSGRLYQQMFLGLAPLEQAARLEAWTPLFLQQFGWFGSALAALGLVVGGRPCGPLRWAPLALGLVAVLFAVGYASFDAQVYLLPAVLAGAIYLGLGAARLLQAAQRRSGGAPVLALALLGVVVWSGPATAAMVDASGDRRAIDYAATVLAQAPPGATIFTLDDQSSFPLWYDHFALGRRPDLRIVVAPLLEFDWYRSGLIATYAVPIPATGDRVELEAALAAAGPTCFARADQQPALSCASP